MCVALCCVVCGARRNLFGWVFGCVEGKGVYCGNNCMEEKFLFL